MSNTVLIHGPQGCGKIRNAQALAAHFGCSQVVDDWNGRWPWRSGSARAVRRMRRCNPWCAPVVMNMVGEISNSIRMGRAARFPVSLHLLSGKFEPAVALAAAGSLFFAGQGAAGLTVSR